MNTTAIRTGAALLLLTACSVDPIIGNRDAGTTEDDGDPGDGADGTPSDGADGTGDGATGDGATGDGATGDGATGDGDTGDGSTGELPSCERGRLEGENSCSVCCIVDGDIIDWCEDLPCTACQEGALEIEPGATKHLGCNTCTCDRDGSVRCTEEACEVDCDAAADACPWRTDSAMHVFYQRGDGTSLAHSDLDGFWANTPNGGLFLEQAQIVELDALLAAPALRDFVRTGQGDCPALDGYWSDLRSGEQAAAEGRFSLTLYGSGRPARVYTRMLSGACEVPALAPLNAFLAGLIP